MKLRLLILFMSFLAAQAVMAQDISPVGNENEEDPEQQQLQGCFNPSVNGWELLTNIQVNQNLVLIAPALCAE